jgi:hypothetical protein
MGITNGIATKLGLAGTAILSLVALIQPLLDLTGRQAADGSSHYATLAAIVGAVTIIGRMLQAAAQERDAPSPAQLSEDATLPDDDLEPEPSDEQLETRFKGDPPHVKTTVSPPLHRIPDDAPPHDPER